MILRVLQVLAQVKQSYVQKFPRTAWPHGNSEERRTLGLSSALEFNCPGAHLFPEQSGWDRGAETN